jgi:hypothetical protein
MSLDDTDDYLDELLDARCILSKEKYSSNVLFDESKYPLIVLLIF